MFKNIYYNTKTNTIHLWEEINGESFYDEIYWTPYCFIDDINGDVDTIWGTKASRRDFNSNTEYQNFCKNRDNVYENKMVPVVQFLSERYHNIQIEDIDPPKLKKYSVDIEVDVPENSPFPDLENPIYEISLITVTDIDTGKAYTFGFKPFKNKTKYDVEYFSCSSEKILLKSFFGWWQKNYPDVITGWNINADFKVNLTGGFDLPYIINRTKVLFGEKTFLYKKLSPLGKVNIFKKESTDTFIVNIEGVSILDYFALYKWYSPKNLEDYKLETVAQHELDEGKLEYQGSLSKLLNTQWDKYVEYNIKDTYIIKKLEEKLGYIQLAQFVTMLCRCPLKMYSSTTNLIEGLMLTRFRRNNQCAPYFEGGRQEAYEAAYVKTPISGLYKWLFSLDIASSYPFSIITLNMSIETLYGKIIGMSEDDVMKYTEKKEFPEFIMLKDKRRVKIRNDVLKIFNSAVKKKLFSIAPTGAIFLNSPKGVFASMERDVYLKRKEVKRQMFEETRKYNETGIEEHKRKMDNLNTLQKSLKIVINGAYGCTAVPYSRYFSPIIAEAVTAVGRKSLRSGEEFTNYILNNPTNEIKNILMEI